MGNELLNQGALRSNGIVIASESEAIPLSSPSQCWIASSLALLAMTAEGSISTERARAACVTHFEVRGLGGQPLRWNLTIEGREPSNC